MGEHPCTLCVVPRGGLDLMGHKSHLSSGCASSYHLGSRLVVPGLEPNVRQRLTLFSVVFSGPIRDRVGSQVSGAEALIVRPELAVFPLNVCPPFSHHCHPCCRGTRGACAHWKKRSQTTGWLLTEVQATSNVPPVPAPAVASPTLLKRSLWSETPWSLTADHFSQPLLSLPC